MRKLIERIQSGHERAFVSSANRLAHLFQVENLSRVAVVGVQHLVPTNLRMFKWLIDALDIVPNNIHLLGKCYSSNRASILEYDRLGIKVSPDSLLYCSDRSFTEYFEESIERLWLEATRHIDDGVVDTVLILDDGGHLICRAAMDSQFRSRFRIVGIEQTTSGFRAHERKVALPVINVARSHPKLADEARIIATSVVDRALERLDPAVTHRGLVIGAGALGRRITDRLRQRGEEARMFDANHVRSEMTTDGFNNGLGKVTYIVGATGNVAIREADLPRLRAGCTLMSASSGDSEFPSRAIRARSEERSSDCRGTIHSDGITLPNSGFPINFVRDPVLTDPEAMYLTRSLTVAALLQGAATAKEVRKWLVAA